LSTRFQRTRFLGRRVPAPLRSGAPWIFIFGFLGFSLKVLPDLAFFPPPPNVPTGAGPFDHGECFSPPPFDGVEFLFFAPMFLPPFGGPLMFPEGFPSGLHPPLSSVRATRVSLSTAMYRLFPAFTLFGFCRPPFWELCGSDPPFVRDPFNRRGCLYGKEFFGCRPRLISSWGLCGNLLSHPPFRSPGFSFSDNFAGAPSFSTSNFAFGG